MSDNDFIQVKNPISLNLEQINKTSSRVSNQQYKEVLNALANTHYIENPTKITNELLKEQNEVISDLNSKLESANVEIERIHYENMKCNAQIEVLNKTIDEQNDKLGRLKDINTKLKQTNDELKKSSLHKYRNGIIIGLIPPLIILIIEHLSEIYTFTLSLIK